MKTLSGRGFLAQRKGMSVPMTKSFTLRPKILEVIRYNIAYHLHASKYLLEENRFKGRSVLLAGPARTLSDDLEAFPIDEFDLVVKMNNGLNVSLPTRPENTLRCDVLFHSLTDDIPCVTREALDRAGVSCLVHRTTGKGRFPLTMKASRDFGSDFRCVRLVSPERYRSLSERLNGASPTTGLVCLDFLLSCDVAALTVAGFTFFQTKYLDGYDDRDKSDHDSMARVREAAHHDPAGERQIAMQLIDEARRAGKMVKLGAAVEAALQGRFLDNPM